MIRPATALLEETADLAQQVRCALCTALPEAWLELELPVRHLAALVLLAQREGLHVAGLAILLGTSRPTASKLVDELVGRGLVSRAEDPPDRRRTMVRLTDAGRATVELLYGWREQELRRALGQLAAADLQALLRGLRALAGSAEGTGAAGAPAPPARRAPTPDLPYGLSNGAPPAQGAMRHAASLDGRRQR